MEHESSAPALPWEILDRYARGIATAEEMRLVHRAFDSDMEEHGDGVAQRDVAFRLWIAGQRSYPDGTMHEGAWHRVATAAGIHTKHVNASSATEQAIARPETASGTISLKSIPNANQRRETASPAPHRQIGRMHQRGVLRPWSWALGAGAVMLAAALAYFPRGTHSNDAGRRGVRVYTTGAAQQASLTLTDGTRVTLAPGATLRLAQFDARSRVVVLDGEGYFDVAGAAGVPFVVRSGGFMTRVLGTSFLLRYNATQETLHAAVSDGKIQVSSPHARTGALGAIVTAGTMAEVTDSTTRLSRLDELVPGSEWRRGKLVFHDTPVSVVLSTLGRWYGYAFLCADSAVVQQRVTLIVNMQSSSAALATLEENLSVNLTVRGDTVTLVPRTASPPRGTTRKQSYELWAPAREVGR